MARSRNPLLVVDDEEPNRDMLSRRLRRAGFEVETASGGNEALRLLQEKEFELVLLDNMMPHMSGIELLKLLRGTYSQTDLPVIMVTALSEGEKVAEALALGANDYVTKPVDFQVALARIQSQLNRRNAEQTHRRSEERLALAASARNDGLWDWDFETGKVYYSPRWKEILGYAEAEIGDSQQEWLTRIHEVDRQDVEIQLELLSQNSIANEFFSEHRVLHKDGKYRWIASRGVIVRSADGEASRIVGSLTDITERKTFDSLTGLPNRTHFVESLRQILQNCNAGLAPPFCLLLVGLDQFKDVNNSLGHHAGDQLLMETGRRLIKTVRDGSLRRGAACDQVGRFSGDEFALLLGEVSNVEKAMDIASRLQTAVGKPVYLDTKSTYVTASIGVAIWNTPYQEPSEMLRDVEIALHRAKSLGRAGVAAFEPSMKAEALQRLELESDLQRAINRKEFLVYYQPKVFLSTGEISGFEALVRWQHPSRGFISPSEFIPTAEATGLILPIGEFVLRESCMTAKRWHDEFPNRPPLDISVNLSPRQFHDVDLVNKVRAILKETGLEPSRLKLEVTESSLIEDWSSTVDTLRTLQDMQVGIKIDDFGTGHSALSYLSQLPCDSLKIDQSFVGQMLSDHKSHEIVRSVIGLAASLGLSVVAEGIETREQMDRLRELGCQIGQGYYYAKPLSLEMAHSFIKAGYQAGRLAG